MFRFLDLPRELRDRVYAMVLDIRSPAPTSQTVTKGRWREYGFPVQRQYWSQVEMGDHPYLWYEETLCENACSGLLASSRQVSNETVEAINRLNETTERGICYVLDCVTMGHPLRTLCPTWTALPAPLKHLKTVEVNFHDHNDSRRDWAEGSPIVRVLLTILGQFITRGPQLTCKSCNKNKIDKYRSVKCNRCAQKHVKARSLVSRCDVDETYSKSIPRSFVMSLTVSN